MLKSLFNYFRSNGSTTNLSVTQQEINNEEDKVKNINCRNIEDDWTLIETQHQTPLKKSYASKCKKLKNKKKRYCKPPNGKANRADTSSDDEMDESWFITPPPCFSPPSAAAGPVVLPTSPIEDLLIEHPSMSVYLMNSNNNKRLVGNCCSQSFNDNNKELIKEDEQISNITNSMSCIQENESHIISIPFDLSDWESHAACACDMNSMNIINANIELKEKEEEEEEEEEDIPPHVELKQVDRFEKLNHQMESNWEEQMNSYPKSKCVSPTFKECSYLLKLFSMQKYARFGRMCYPFGKTDDTGEMLHSWLLNDLRLYKLHLMFAYHFTTGSDDALTFEEVFNRVGINYFLHDLRATGSDHRFRMALTSGTYRMWKLKAAQQQCIEDAMNSSQFDTFKSDGNCNCSQKILIYYDLKPNDSGYLKRLIYHWKHIYDELKSNNNALIMKRSDDRQKQSHSVTENGVQTVKKPNKLDENPKKNGNRKKNEIPAVLNILKQKEIQVNSRKKIPSRRPIQIFVVNKSKFTWHRQRKDRYQCDIHSRVNNNRKNH